MALHEALPQPEYGQTPRPASPVYRLLPSALQTGLQPLALVRRSLSDYSLRSRRRVTSLAMCRTKRDDAQVETAISSSCEMDSAEMSGICWKFARHGSNTLQASLAESQSSNSQTQAFSRQIYIDAVAYLVQGLPCDLTDQETLHLRNALPESLTNATSPGAIPPKERTPSLLHRSLASTIVAISLLVRLAFPYIKLFIAAAYSYDRAYNVRERLFAFGVNAADSLGKTSMALAGTAVTNEVVLGAVTYCVDGIRGGLSEGLGEGMKVIEAQP